MTDKQEITIYSSITPLIYEVRGVKVMLDRDLATLYQLPTSQLKRQVKRNITRFPHDFMFELTHEEYNALRCKNGTLNVGRGQHSKYLPFVFTELGVAMLSSVLNSEIAVQVNINIMRAFVTMRKSIKHSLDLQDIQKELERQRNYIEDILRDQNDTNEDVQQQLDAISLSLAQLQADVAPTRLPPNPIKGFNG